MGMFLFVKASDYANKFAQSCRITPKNTPIYLHFSVISFLAATGKSKRQKNDTIKIARVYLLFFRNDSAGACVPWYACSEA